MELRELVEKDQLNEEESVRAFNGMFDEIWRPLLPQQIHIEELPARVSSNVITTTDTPVPECASCGLCCAAFVRVPAEPDCGVEDEEALKVTMNVAGEDLVVDRFVRRDPENFRCSSLKGELGVKVSCMIYERRPITCRRFEAGSDRCHAVRRAYGLDPFLSIEEMNDALDRLAQRQQGTRDGDPMIESVSFRKTEGERRLLIEAGMSDGSVVCLHEFDPLQEVWYRSQFEGLTLFQARKVIGGR